MRNCRKFAAGMLTIVLLFAVAGCEEDTPVSPDKNTPVMTNHGALVRTRDEVAAIIAKELSVGAPSSAIEEFFRNHSLSWIFESYGRTSEYHSLSRISRFHAISIVIRVDAQKRMTLAEVHDSYTGL